MGRSLVKQIQENVDHFDYEAMRSFSHELGFIREHVGLVESLREWDAEKEVWNDATTDAILESATGQMMLLKSVSSRPLPASSVFLVETLCSPYDDFNWLLLSSDYANYFAGIRAHYAAGIEYGDVEDWVIWSYGNGKTGPRLVRTIVRGKLSALHMHFTDAVTYAVARDAGVDASHMRVPLMMARLKALKDFKI